MTRLVIYSLSRNTGTRLNKLSNLLTTPFPSHVDKHFFQEFEPLKEMTQRICTDVLPAPHPSQSMSHHQKSSTTSATNEFQFSNMK